MTNNPKKQKMFKFKKEYLILYKNKKENDKKWRVWEGPYENKYLVESMAKAYLKREGFAEKYEFATKAIYIVKFRFGFSGFVKKAK